MVEVETDGDEVSYDETRNGEVKIKKESIPERDLEELREQNEERY